MSDLILSHSNSPRNPQSGGRPKVYLVTYQITDLHRLARLLKLPTIDIQQDKEEVTHERIQGANHA